jgi:hypothetical protein
MIDVFIFYDDWSAEIPAINKMQLGDTKISLFSHRQVMNDMFRLEGFRPHVIINTVKPFPELEMEQRHMTIINGAPIIDTWIKEGDDDD